MPRTEGSTTSSIELLCLLESNVPLAFFVLASQTASTGSPMIPLIKIADNPRQSLVSMSKEMVKNPQLALLPAPLSSSTGGQSISLPSLGAAAVHIKYYRPRPMISMVTDLHTAGT